MIEKKIRNNIFTCCHKWVKNGHKNGKQIWMCIKCGKSKSISRKNLTKIAWASKFIDYILNLKTTSDYGCNSSTFRRNTKIFNTITIPLPKSKHKSKQLILDGKYVNEDLTFLIAHDGEYAISYLRCEKETPDKWDEFLSKLPAPLYVVCDGMNGLIKAVKLRFHGTLIQRCQFHIIQNFVQKFSKHLLTAPAKELRKITFMITKIRTPFRMKIWWNLFKTFSDNFDYYYEHKKMFFKTKESIELKKVKAFKKKLIKLWTSGDLFRWVLEDSFRVFNTVNKAEGGINRDIADLVRYHRGLDVDQQATMIELYLLSKSKGYNKKKIAYWLSRKNAH